jgi:CubicO group peptidase (beta-lactamase class C family)
VATTNRRPDVLPTSPECRHAAESAAQAGPHLAFEDPDPHPWETATPDDVGLDGDLLSAAASNVALSDRAASFLVIRHGKLVFERYFNGSGATEANTLASLSKSILSLLVGIAIDQGELDLDTPISELLPDALLPRDDGLTVRHLLTMSSGLEWDENEDSDVLDVRGTLDRPRASAPGEAFNYNTGLTHVLSAVLTHASGRSTCDDARGRLFAPLGVTADHLVARWNPDRVRGAVGRRAPRLDPGRRQRRGDRPRPRVPPSLVTGRETAGHVLAGLHGGPDRPGRRRAARDPGHRGRGRRADLVAGRGLGGVLELPPAVAVTRSETTGSRP